MRNRAEKDPAALVNAISVVLTEQTVTVSGTAAVELVVPQLTTNIEAPQTQRDTIAEQVEEMLESFPLAQVLMSVPGVSIKTASSILLPVGDYQPTSRRPPGSRARRFVASLPPGPTVSS